jgi:hypothetical protein
MGVIEIVTLALTAFMKFGPLAVEEFNKWRAGCENPDAPTKAEWDGLQAAIDDL